MLDAELFHYGCPRMYITSEKKTKKKKDKQKYNSNIKDGKVSVFFLQ